MSSLGNPMHSCRSSSPSSTAASGMMTSNQRIDHRHSRMIVVVEQLKDGSIYLLVFDPSHSPHQMLQFRNTATAISGMRLIKKSLSAMKARQYQVVAVCSIMDTEQEYQQSKVLRSIRVPQNR